MVDAQEAEKAQVLRIAAPLVEPQSGTAAAFEDPNSESYPISGETLFCD